MKDNNDCECFQASSLTTICACLQVRKVEYVDKMEEEWELFQRSMKEETHVGTTSLQAH